VGEDITEGSELTNYPTVCAETVFDLVDLDQRAVPVDVELSYHTGDPHAVRLRLALRGCTPVTWLVSRSLLAEGMLATTGEGDVRLWPLSNDHALLELRSDEGVATFRAPVPELEEFLADTYDVIAPSREAEWLDIDAALEGLLTAEAEHQNRNDS
jgi:hypothetical protein